MLNRCHAFLDRIRGEYNEMPDLKLTNWQACRLWNLDAQLCDDILAMLVTEGFLWRTPSGAYLRRAVARSRVIRASGPDWFPAGPADDQAEVEREERGDDDSIPDGTRETRDRPDQDIDAELVALGV